MANLSDIVSPSGLVKQSSNLGQFGNAFTLPTSDGTSGQVLQTNGSGTIGFSTVESGVTTGKAIAMAIVFG